MPGLSFYHMVAQFLLEPSLKDSVKQLWTTKGTVKVSLICLLPDSIWKCHQIREP